MDESYSEWGVNFVSTFDKKLSILPVIYKKSWLTALDKSMMNLTCIMITSSHTISAIVLSYVVFMYLFDFCNPFFKEMMIWHDIILSFVLYW